MKKIASLREWRAWRAEVPRPVGFVPTMGALHRGHRSLMERARGQCATGVASVFVNPTQFNDPSDCSSYPDTLEADLDMAREVGMDAVFTPSFRMLYPDDYRYRVTEVDQSLPLEGARRPGHFDGVLTVVLKLLQIIAPDRAYFGEKDWQQLELVRGMVDAFFLPVDIVACPTVREPDGLAMSSRNRRLSVAARMRAPDFHRALVASPSAEVARRRLESAGFSVQYIEDVGGRRHGAVLLEGVRLIDNVPLTPTAVVVETAAGKGKGSSI